MSNNIDDTTGRGNGFPSHNIESTQKDKNWIAQYIKAAWAEYSTYYPDHKVSVAIGATGEVKGDITAHRVMVAGKIEGNIYADERVEFHKDSIVHGDISYGSIAVEHGAKLLGLVIQNSGSSSAQADAKNVIHNAQTIKPN